MGIPRAWGGWKRETLVRGRRRQNRSRYKPRIEGLEGRALLTVLIVMNNDDDGPGSLRAEVATAAAGDVITFAPQLDGQTITLTTGAIIPQNDITIEGPAPELLAISGNDSSGILQLMGTSLSISDLTLENGHAKWGAAISQDVTYAPINVSQCDFSNNVAQTPDGLNYAALGGAISSPSPVTIDHCDFTGNRAIGGDRDTGITAAGGAIWVDGRNLQITDSHFTDNHAWAGAGENGDAGSASGGAIAWAQTSEDEATSGLTISITNSSFDSNSAAGGSADNAHSGGDAFGGAVDILSVNESSLTATVSNNRVDNNFVEAGTGLVGGLAEGGSLRLNAGGGDASSFHADNNQFDNSTAVGGLSSAPQDSDAPGHSGAAYGGAVAYSTSGAPPKFTFDGDHVNHAAARGGSAQQFRVGVARAQGGDARGGGLYLDATQSVNAGLTVSGSTFDTDRAIGGKGGSAGVNGRPGGDASGGGIAAVVSSSGVYVAEFGAKITIDGTSVTNCSATGGAGGNAIQTANAPGGRGGNGGNSFGGGISLDPGSSFGTVFNVTNDRLVSDKAIGAVGGPGANGAHGFNGGNGGSGGTANGGGLAVTLGINGYADEGNGDAELLRVNVANSKLLVDEAIGGKGGYAGNGLKPGIGGPGGNALGGAVSLRGFNGDLTNLVTFDTDFLFACTAAGGTGGAGGIGIAVPGGTGGQGGAGLGGGLDVIFKGATHLLNTTIVGNHAVGGKGGKGGSGLGGFGPNGQNGIGAGGGVRVAAPAGITAARDSNTVIIANSADIGADIYGTLGNI
jgi:hypothetical protein